MSIDWLHDDVALLRMNYAKERRKPIPANAAWIGVETDHGLLRVLHHRPLPAAGSGSAIVYLHGGGWIAGSPETHADISLALCERSGIDLYSVDYRLAPENPAPAPIDDALSVVKFLLRHSLVDGHSRSVVLCGDSAGGSIALAAERHAPEELRNHIAGVCSAYGGYGLFKSSSMTQYGNREDGLDAQCLHRYWTLAKGKAGGSPYAAGALAQPSPVPVLLVAGTCDPLRDDAIDLAARLGKIGRETTLHLVSGGAHGFLHDAGNSTVSRRTMRSMTTWMRDALNL